MEDEPNAPVPLHRAPNPRGSELDEDEQRLENALLLIFSDNNISRLHWIAEEHGIDLIAAANIAVSSEYRGLNP